MIRDFKVEEQENAGFLKHVFNEMISLEFISMSDKEKLELLELLDRVITENSDIPSANIYFGPTNVEKTNNIYIDNYTQTTDGLEILLTYFYKKRKQYQLYCIEKNDNGVYSEVEMDQIKAFYEVSPITGIKAEVPYKEGSYKKYFNINNFDAFTYASDQLDKAISLIDFQYKIEGYDLFQRIKFIYMIRKALNDKTKTMIKISKVFNNEKKFDKIIKDIDKRAEMIEDEIVQIEVLKKNLVDLKDHEKGHIFMGVCFKEDIWKNLNNKEKDIAIKGLSKIISDLMGVDYCNKVKYSEDNLLNLNVINDKTICVGNLENKTAREVAISIAYAYSIIVAHNKISEHEDEGYKSMLLADYSACKKYVSEKDYEGLKHSQFVNIVSECAVNILNSSYEIIANSPLLTGKNVKMTYPKEAFLYNHYNNLTKGGK